MTVFQKDNLVRATPIAATGPRVGPPEISEAALWAGFSAARTAGEFCESWLSLQCREFAGAKCAVLLLREDGGRFAPAAVWPSPQHDVRHLAAAAQDALMQRAGKVTNAGNHVQVAYPIEVSDALHGVVVIELTELPQDQIVRIMRRLHWGAGWLETLFRRREAEQNVARSARQDLTLDLLARAAEHPSQRESATAVATHLSLALECSRVSIGVVQGRNIRLCAISHQASFQEQAQIVDAIENAMEEALDQDSALAFPATAATARRIALAQAELGRKTGARAVLSVPLASAGRPVGIITLEREQDRPFTDEDIARVAGVAAAFGPLVEARAQSQKLIAGTIADTTTDWMKKLFGPRRPGLKLAVGLGALAAIWLAVATDDFRVSAKTVIEGTVQRAAVAPFEGFIAQAPVRAGDRVQEGQVLAALDDRDLALEAGRWRAEREQQALKYQEALGKQDRAQARILAAQIKQAEAQLALLESKLARAQIKAPFAGTVVSGDLSQMLGAPVETGKILFEIAPLNSYRAALQVDERDLGFMKAGQEGVLRLAGRASVPVPVRVTKVTPVASAADGRNSFRVEADLLEPPVWLSPGMEGVSKVVIEERSVVWIWTRSLIEWVRLATWTWWP